MRRACFILLFSVTAALGQTTPPPAPLISAYYSMDNGAALAQAQTILAATPGTYTADQITTAKATIANAYRWMVIDSPLSLAVDAAGRPHLGVPNLLTITTDNGAVVGSTNNISLQSGNGIIFGFTPVPGTAPGLPGSINIQQSVDTTLFAVRKTLVHNPGPCLDAVTGQDAASGSWDAADGFFYTCVPAPVPALGTAWQSGSATISADAVIGSSGISVSGLTPNGTILATDQVIVDGVSYGLTGAATADATGNASIIVAKPLTTAVTAGDPITAPQGLPAHPFIVERAALSAAW